MSRTYITISDQNTYDICVQNFGGLDDVDEVMRQVLDLNDVSPLGTEFTLSNTDDELARQFDVNNIRFATGMPIPPTSGAYNKDYSDDYNTVT
jgi:hypothetical protein